MQYLLKILEAQNSFDEFLLKILFPDWRNFVTPKPMKEICRKCIIHDISFNILKFYGELTSRPEVAF